MTWKEVAKQENFGEEDREGKLRESVKESCGREGNLQKGSFEIGKVAERGTERREWKKKEKGICEGKLQNRRIYGR